MPVTPSAAQSKPSKVTRVVHVAPGVIRSDETYTLREFAKRAGLGRWGIRKMQAAGLPVLRFNGRIWVDGSEFREWIRLKGRASSGGEN